MKYPFFIMLLIMVLTGCIVDAGDESVKPDDYQRCLDAEKMGGGDMIQERCGQLRQEITE